MQFVADGTFEIDNGLLLWSEVSLIPLSGFRCSAPHMDLSPSTCLLNCFLLAKRCSKPDMPLL